MYSEFSASTKAPAAVAAKVSISEIWIMSQRRSVRAMKLRASSTTSSTFGWRSQVPGEVAKRAGQRAQHVAVELDAEHRALIEVERRQDVAPAADADHADVGLAFYLVDRVGHVVAQKLERPADRR